MLQSGGSTLYMILCLPSEPAKTNDPLMHFPDAAVDATALELVEPPAPGVDGTLRAGKRWPFSFNRCVRCCVCLLLLCSNKQGILY